MLWDSENIYIFFECEDRYLNASVSQRDGQTYLDDCAEIFLIPAPAPLNFHFGFEVNLLKASNDFIFLTPFYESYNAAIKSYSPDFQVAVSLDGTLNDNSDTDQGWTMELALPLSLFEGVDKLSPVKPLTRWAFQALRQERNDPESGRRVWSSFFPLHKKSSDVHDPQDFGLLEFVE